MKKFAVLGMVALSIGYAFSAAKLPLSDEEALGIARKILAKMSLEEKVSLLGGIGTMNLKAFPQFGISREWEFSDCSHAVKPKHARELFGYADGYDNRCTVFPSLDALASTWNTDLARQMGDAQAEQLLARGRDQMLGPGVNINRTPLCGRCWEYLGEDPFLAGRFAAAIVKAAQSHGVAATVKHFALNNQELNRRATDVVVDERTLHEIYLPAFEAAIREGGALSVMSSYNKYNGQHASENSFLLRGILREKWGFKGTVISDWDGHHSTVPAALNGATIEMNYGRGIVYFTDFYNNRLPLADAVKAKEVPPDNVDDMALRVLYVMAKTGFLTGEQEKGRVLAPEHRALAEKIAEESVVLLKNDGTLPLKKPTKGSVVVAGLLADTKYTHLGSSCEARAEHEVTPLEGLKAYLGKDVEVKLFPLGGECVDGDHPRPIPTGLLESFDGSGADAFAVRSWEASYWKSHNEYLLDHKPADKVVRVEQVAGEWQEREYQFAIFNAKVKLPATGTYLLVGEQDPSTRLRWAINGQFANGWLRGKVASELTGKEGEVVDLSIEMLADAKKPGKFVFGWLLPIQRAGGAQVFREECKKAEQVLVFTGTRMGRGRACESESGDRFDLRGPDGHDRAINEILSWGLKNVVIIQRSGAQEEMPYADAAKALIHSPYLGQEGGHALAKVLYGEVNPSGRLVASWPRQFGDMGVVQRGTYDRERSFYGERFYVGYRWFDAQLITPLFPFGYGLSYTKFEMDKPELKRTESGWSARIAVRNVGKLTGKETVQLYVSEVSPQTERAVKELKGFAKVEVKPGETTTATIEIPLRALAYFDTFIHRWRAPKGDYDFIFAESSAKADERHRVRVTLEQDVCFD